MASVGCLLLACSVILFAISTRNSFQASNSLDRLWLDYRRAFGLFWSLRVQERMNDAALRYEWPIELAWHGWVTKTGQPLSHEISPAQQRLILITLRGLLRRFVSHAWINERLASNEAEE